MNNFTDLRPTLKEKYWMRKMVFSANLNLDFQKSNDFPPRVVMHISGMSVRSLLSKIIIVFMMIQLTLKYGYKYVSLENFYKIICVFLFFYFSFVFLSFFFFIYNWEFSNGSLFKCQYFLQGIFNSNKLSGTFLEYLISEYLTYILSMYYIYIYHYYY